MNQFNSNKILSYYEDALTIKKGGMPAPRMALIYPTYKCNCACEHCLCKEMNNNTNTIELSILEFKQLIVQLKNIGVKAIEFCGGGEPLLYPNIENLIRFIRSQNMELGVLTNGSTLGVHYKTLIDNATYIRVSIDTLSDSTYESTKHPRGHNLSNILRGLLMLTKYKKSTDSKCSLGLKTTLSRHNINEIKDLIKYTDNSEFDYIQFKSVRSDESELTFAQKSEAQDHLDYSLSKKVIGNVLTSKLTVSCSMSPVHTVIDSYGDVYLCCYFQYRKKSHKIGNIHENTFSEIWHSSKHKNAIKNIKKKECDKYDCRFHHYNEIMHKVIIENKMHINFI